MRIARKLIIAALTAVAATSFGQVPDLLNAFDAGGRAMGAGGAFSTTAANPLSANTNPAGLGFISQRTASFAARSFPTTKTRVTGPLENLRLDSNSSGGDLRFSHVGMAMPMSGNRGTLGVSYSVGGWYHDDQRGTNLPGGIQNFLDSVKLRTEFLNISWGKASSDMSSSFGFGIVVANQANYNRRRVQFSDPNIPTQDSRSEDSGYGVGLQAGMMWIPKGQPNLTAALSVRTPIEIDDSEGALGLYNKIPGRVAGGLALRQDGFRNGNDYLIWGAEFQYFFDAEGSDRVPREDVATGHFGAEYNYTLGNAVIPLRVGYSIVPAGGDGFDDRNGFTYGFGYRPNGKNWSIEINYGRPNGGGMDTGISFTYRF